MEKGELKTGQTLGIVEKNGKLVQEYVAGFFGNEPIIKQRLMTPQETRRYREDLARGQKPGQTSSGPAKPAGRPGTAPAFAGQPGLKKRPLAPGAPLRARPPQTEAAAADTAEDTSMPSQVRTQPARTAAQPASVPETATYVTVSSSDNEKFLQNLINSEPDKANFNAANEQKALKIISQIGSPEMKIYRIGKKSGEAAGVFYSQKEYLARGIMGLPLWKAKVEKPAAPAENPVVPGNSPDQSNKATTLVYADVSAPASEEPATYENNQV